MPCNECGCKKSSEQASLVEEASNLTLADRNAPASSCCSKSSVKSCCSPNSSCCSQSRPNRGCSCCCRSCCACCRCCSQSRGDYCLDRINEARGRSCSCSNKKEEVLTPAPPASSGCECCRRNN
ncbi:hypothetical protein NQ315_003127 [Exocentrus adspersus]|uniref:Metallothionein n=1 Tax=Exocentrus adspersus TaxID=1586481 RepID=A0AAV8W595_9CUCU|nr:hypothetical protein NQ315_003127 [Exocentrus adspersus]